MANPKGTPTNLLPAWEKGTSGNPAGRPVGVRNRINAKFLETLEKDFEQGGEEAIKRCRLEDPSAYVRALMALQPKEMQVATSPIDTLTDEQLEAALAYLAEITQPDATRQ